jgi:hypothetical protein
MESWSFGREQILFLRLKISYHAISESRDYIDGGTVSSIFALSRVIFKTVNSPSYLILVRDLYHGGIKHLLTWQKYNNFFHVGGKTFTMNEIVYSLFGWEKIVIAGRQDLSGTGGFFLTPFADSRIFYPQ